MDPQLNPGDVLKLVAGQDASTMTSKQLAITIRDAPRPLEITFMRLGEGGFGVIVFFVFLYFFYYLSLSLSLSLFPLSVFLSFARPPPHQSTLRYRFLFIHLSMRRMNPSRQ